MSFEKTAKGSGTRRKARECALQMLFAADVVKLQNDRLTVDYWNELGDEGMDDKTQEFADNLVRGALADRADGYRRPKRSSSRGL
jgi:N utilization substance protein B